MDMIKGVPRNMDMMKGVTNNTNNKRVMHDTNKCSFRSMKVQLPALLGNDDRPNKLTNGHEGS